jgi:hypothetical protein
MKRLLKAVEALLDEIPVLPFYHPAGTDCGAFAPNWRLANRKSIANYPGRLNHRT